jgi:hypothetical protein
MKMALECTGVAHSLAPFIEIARFLSDVTLSPVGEGRGAGRMFNPSLQAATIFLSASNEIAVLSIAVLPSG